MKKWIVNIFKYGLFLVISVVIFAYVYREQNIDKTIDYLLNADYRWVLLSVIASLFSHLSRAWRWVISLRPLGHNARLVTAFMGVMFGYVVNMAVPRLGEVARCGLLKRTDNVPISQSFGAVVAERALDLMMLTITIIIGLFLEFDKIKSYVLDHIQSPENLTLKIVIGCILLAGALTLTILYFIFRNRLHDIPFYDKTIGFLTGLKDGIFSIRRMTQGQKIAYLLNSAFIWLMYYFMAYLLVFSLAETASLPASSGVIMLVMSAFAMVIPAPAAGAGPYHAFIIAGLTYFYGVDIQIANIFAFLMHGSQLLSVLVVGLIGFVISLRFKPREPHPPLEDPADTIAQ